MSKEFIIKNGFISKGDSVIDGSLSSESITGETLHLNSLGSGTPITNIGIDSNGDVVSGSPVSTFFIFNTSPTSPDPKNIYDDGNIRIWFDESSSDDVECEVLVNPSSGKVHFNWHEHTDDKSGAADVNTSSGVIPLNQLYDNDDKMNIVVWAPEDSSYPYYEIDITKSNSTYTSVPAIIKVTKWSTY